MLRPEIGPAILEVLQLVDFQAGSLASFYCSQYCVQTGQLKLHSVQLGEAS